MGRRRAVEGRDRSGTPATRTGPPAQQPATCSRAHRPPQPRMVIGQPRRDHPPHRRPAPAGRQHPRVLRHRQGCHRPRLARPARVSRESPACLSDGPARTSPAAGARSSRGDAGSGSTSFRPLVVHVSPQSEPPKSQLRQLKSRCAAGRKLDQSFVIPSGLRAFTCGILGCGALSRRWPSAHHRRSVAESALGALIDTRSSRRE